MLLEIGGNEKDLKTYPAGSTFSSAGRIPRTDRKAAPSWDSLFARACLRYLRTPSQIAKAKIMTPTTTKPAMYSGLRDDDDVASVGKEERNERWMTGIVFAVDFVQCSSLPVKTLNKERGGKKSVGCAGCGG